MTHSHKGFGVSIEGRWYGDRYELWVRGSLSLYIYIYIYIYIHISSLFETWELDLNEKACNVELQQHLAIWFLQRKEYVSERPNHFYKSDWSHREPVVYICNHVQTWDSLVR